MELKAVDRLTGVRVGFQRGIQNMELKAGCLRLCTGILFDPIGIQNMELKGVLNTKLSD